MGLAFIFFTCLFGYAVYRENQVSLLIRDELAKIAENRSEYEKHLIKEEWDNDPQVVENIDSFISIEDMMKSDVVVEMCFELRRIELIRGFSFYTSLILLACVISIH